MKNLAIVGGNYGNAGAIRGAEKGALIIKNYILNNYDVEDAGDLPDYSYSNYENLDCIYEFKSITSILYEKVYNNLNKGKRVITIGGDHSIAFGTIWGASEFAKKKGLNFGLIYIDAHGDINNCKNSLSKHLHGMPLAYAVGIEDYGYDKLSKSILNPKNILYIGSRSLDNFEKSFIITHAIPVITSYNINISKLEKVIDKISKFINENELQLIHLSIDIDVVDPLYAPGTGVPEIDGLSPKIFLDIIEYVCRQKNIFSIDFVEFNPLLDIDKKTESLCKEVCDTIILNI